VSADGPASFPFAYSVGLFGLGHPEVLITGVGPETAAYVINVVATRVRDGRDLVPGRGAQPPALDASPFGRVPVQSGGVGLGR
jgi:hypothetical protein